MKLLDWLRDNDIGDDDFAKLVGDCTGHAVKKWKYGERQPPGDKIIRIEEVTNRAVTLRDLVAMPDAPAEPSPAGVCP
jgi:hypothetical protein